MARRRIEKYVVVNADEGDSGTFADRMIMEGDPFALIEGMIIAATPSAPRKAMSICAPNIRSPKRCASAEAIERRAKPIGSATTSRERNTPSIELRMGAGAYVCGEETSLLESSRASAASCAPSRRSRRIDGLFGKPTIINNVISRSRRPDDHRQGRAVLRRLRRRPLARHHAAADRRQRQIWRPVRNRLRHDARRDHQRDRRRHAFRPSRARRSGRRSARRLCPGQGLRPHL
ncbi:hypothetical protein [Methylocystis parvus]|uniref:hypothetical protein n=1 Tax=Methylocystis parvus TaxID=134 RepID=UPI003C72AB94